MIVFLLVSLFFACHGLMMLFVPRAVNVFSDWWVEWMGLGSLSERERRRETRIAGVVMTAMGIGFFVFGLHAWFHHPAAVKITPEQVDPSWGSFLFGISMLVAGYYTMITAERVVRAMLENIPELTLVRQESGSGES